MKIRLRFDKNALWIGLRWCRWDHALYVHPLPMIGLRIPATGPLTANPFFKCGNCGRRSFSFIRHSVCQPGFVALRLCRKCDEQIPF